ncbi:hypothetical protein KQY27_08660 [Methanobrevibacter sp. TMH8]|uniref:hypothetical protein n=1 Tax=Methanobrevibacter sp. TMH8 TaxID=2848611 RepID=UPI001CCEE305|nr:hypothetical protein [Methanobrevibacter sp. TMH8]MBZ9571616.1 hypothetical protein [Methanobrevibacter sp. TMH8]
MVNDTNGTNISNEVNNMYKLNNSVNLDYNNFTRFFANNGSFNVIIINNSNIEEALALVNSELSLDNLNSTEIVISGSNLSDNITILHYNQYFDGNNIGEMTLAYFEINNKVVIIANAGNDVDMNVIESFFKLNKLNS